MTLSKYTGGNAFPWDDDHQHQGLTVLDYFAAPAISHVDMSAIYGKSDAQFYARQAYTLAEAMIEERSERLARVKEEIDAKQGWQP